LKSYFSIALRLTSKSKHPKHRMAAVLIRGGAVVSVAVNLHAWGRHAELRCLRGKAKGDLLVVARSGGRCSKPCKTCEKAIRKAGVTKVVYTNWDGDLVEVRL
jgi:deoxycytidylate deaminase